MKKSIFLTVLLAAFFVSAAIADPGDTLWTRTYGGTGSEQGYMLQLTSDGGFIITGMTTTYGAGAPDYYVVKTDALGNEEWSQAYGGSSLDFGHVVQPTRDGGYIITGRSMSFGAGSYDVYLVKTDASGDTVWTRTYGGSLEDGGRGLWQTADGGYIIGGYTYSFGAGASDVYLVKTDASGNEEWTRTYGGSGYDYAHSLQITSDGGYVLAGWTDSYGAGMQDVYLIKTDALGDTLWTRTYGGATEDYGNIVQQTTDGGYVIAGYTDSYGAGSHDMYLIKTDASGNELWYQTYGGSAGEYCRNIQQTTDGGYILAGRTHSWGAGSYDFYLVKIDADGNVLWDRTYGGSAEDHGYSVKQTNDGGYIVAGHTTSYGVGSWDLYLVRVAGAAPEPDVSIEIIADDPPVTVPQGGSFGFTGSVTNNIEDPQITDAWTMAVGPQKETYGPFKIRNDVALEPFETRAADFNQHVANLAPLGFYTYVAYCGEYPSTVMDSSFFQVEVIAGISSGGDMGWLLTGSFSEGEIDLPSEFALLSNYPNPFNAQTVIQYQLPSAGEVKLEVYNLLGSRVATLVNGKQEGGYKSVTWDASEVSSGVYFYKLSAGEFTEVKRMTLLR